MRRRINRYDDATLTRIALADAHPFQKVAVQALLDHKWRVNLVSPSAKGNRMIIMRHTSDTSIGVAVYPDGSFARSKTPTVKWDWARCDQAAKAETPDPYVANILAGKEAGKTI